MDSLAGAVQIAGDKLLWQRRLLSARKLATWTLPSEDPRGAV